VDAQDVKAAVAEVSRVARNRIYVKISNRHEGGKTELNALKRSGAAVPAALHATALGPPFWLPLFDERGWTLHHMLEDVAHVPWWECCTYIFQPATQETRELARTAMVARSKQNPRAARG